MEKRITFQTIEETAEFIREHAGTSHDYTLNGCDRHTAEALHELSCEYHALRFAIDRLITIIDKKGGAL